MPTHACPKCAQPMEDGFIVDFKEGGPSAAQWVEGPPQTSFWTGLKLRDKQKRQIATFCCPKCGFLESYAKLDDLSSHEDP